MERQETEKIISTKIDPLVESYLRISKIQKRIKAINKTTEVSIMDNKKGFLFDKYA